MESNGGAKDDDGVAAVSAADPAPAVDNKPNADEENAPASVVVTETKAPSISNEASEVDSESVAPSVVVAVDKNTGIDFVTIGDDELIVAMSSATISAADGCDEYRQKQTALKETVEQDNANSINSAFVKSSGVDEEANSTIGEFEDAREYIDDDADNVEKKLECDERSQASIHDDESSGVDEGLENNEENSEDVKESDVPVPVDNDTNDPQYIPRRGRFYEHDDRMAYSTTSSELSESEYEDNSEENDDCRPLRRRRSGSKNRKPITPLEAIECSTSVKVEESISSTKKVLAISKVASTVLPSCNTNSGVVKKPGFGTKKSRNIDSLEKWTHDMYDEHEQAPKSKDELLASYGYDIREESEAPRARRHHKYGRASTTKYTRNWQDTKAYSSNPGGGQQLTKIKRGLNKNKSKPPTSDEYASEFPALDKSKLSEPTVVTENCELRQQIKSPVDQEKKIAVDATVPPRFQEPSSRNSTKFKPPSSNYNAHLDQQNGGSHLPTHNKNYFNRTSSDYPTDVEKVNYNNRDTSSTPSNFFHRQQSNDQSPSNNFKPVHFNSSQGNLRFQHSSALRNRHFPQNHNPQQYNRDRYFSKGSGPNQQNFDQSRHNNLNSITAGTGRTQHGNYNNRLYENDNSHNIPVQPPVVRSSKRYSVQSRRELPDPVLNFGGISKIPQTQQQTSIPQHPQQNGLVVQEQPQSTIQQIQSQQMQSSAQVLQQQATLQIHQQQPIQLQQYHQPIQQLHPHHSMVLDHNTGMMVMAAPDPSMYHQLYAPPQYGTAVTPGATPGGSVDDPSAAAAAASALQMLATQAAVYQPVPTGVPSSSNAQPESFMTTYYQPLQQTTQQQPPPRRVNLAIPIVAPSESNQQQNIPKSNTSTPPLSSTSTN